SRKPALRAGWPGAAGQGFEPQLPVPETGVLPLDDPATMAPDCSRAVTRSPAARPARSGPRRRVGRLALGPQGDALAEGVRLCECSRVGGPGGLARLRSGDHRLRVGLVEAFAFSETHFPYAFASAPFPFDEPLP